MNYITLVGKKITEGVALSLHCDGCDNSDYTEFYFKLSKQVADQKCEIFITREEVMIYCTVAVKASEDMMALTKMFYTANHIYQNFDKYVKDMTP